jgi:hypothetical protein
MGDIWASASSRSGDALPGQRGCRVYRLLSLIQRVGSQRVSCTTPISVACGCLVPVLLSLSLLAVSMMALINGGELWIAGKDAKCVGPMAGATGMKSATTGVAAERVRPSDKSGRLAW